ncbi:helix-turn-helix domain-containing protein [Kitasatospora sp. NPDC057198]|uniref:helix-turn-helix domain-containing protein n=1 Tax=Kitasatospora sp. NPDC057198 TaxID=3346046 RepID=UPI0036444E9A
MVLDPQRWLELRRFRALHQSGAMTVSEIARETGLNRRTVRKYLSEQAPPIPPSASTRRGTRRQVVEEVAPLIDAMLRPELPAQEPARRHRRRRRSRVTAGPGTAWTNPARHKPGTAILPGCLSASTPTSVCPASTSPPTR